MGICVSKDNIKVNPKVKLPIKIDGVKYRKKSIPKALKKIVWDTNIGANIGTAKCKCCKHQDIRQIEFHCGHIIAEANGGKTILSNLLPICAQCNLSMGKMNMNDFTNKYMKN
jgi:5-methylcytosine-specific restriction endonuclease McrA